jgi:hypothetical protein
MAELNKKKKHIYIPPCDGGGGPAELLLTHLRFWLFS